MRLRYSNLICVLLALTLAPALASAQAKPDLSTPKKAAVAFALALQKGDFSTFKNVTTGTDADYKVMQTIMAMTGAANKLHDAAISKFGEDGNKIASTNGNTANISRQVEESDEKVTGDQATITKKGDPETNGIKLTKVGNDWKVDLAHFPQKDQLASQSRVLDATAKVLDQGADDISAGKYKTATEASQDIQQRIMTVAASLIRPQIPTTTPSR